MLGALAAGLLALPGKARADSYGHAEITLGFPNGAVTVGRTWDDHPRRVVVEEVTHKYPEADDEADVEYDDEDDAAYESRSDEPDVVIEKRIVRPAPRKVTIIERYVEPEPCERVRVIRKVYVDRPACGREVVYHRRPVVHVVGGPTVIVAPGRGGHHGGRGWRSYDRHDGPRDLFREEGGRPGRWRGQSRPRVLVGAHSI
jgi:hypothetical protein